MEAIRIRVRDQVWRRLCTTTLFSFAGLFLFTQQTFAADCSIIPDTFARLKCFNRAADAKLPKPKEAKIVEQDGRDKRIRKFGGRPTNERNQEFLICGANTEPSARQR